MRNSLLLFFLLLGFALSAQDVDLRIDTTLSAEALVKNLLGGNRGIEVKEADFKGARQAAGSFKIIGAECCFFKEGIILSTGEAEHARGPNMKSSSGEALGTRGRNHLARMARNVSMDAAMLQFDFKPSGDSLAFEFVFASEEYPHQPQTPHQFQHTLPPPPPQSPTPATLLNRKWPIRTPHRHSVRSV